MAQIAALTPDQEALLPEFRAEWLARGVATGPADRCAVEAGVRKVYEGGGVEPPGLVVWMSSPDGTAHLIHEEHGMLSIGPGCYRIGRQTEQWDQIRVVAD